MAIPMQAEQEHYVHPAGLTYTIPRARAIDLLVARLLFGGYFLYNGINHFLHLEMMSGAVAAAGLPMPDAAVIVTGLLLVFGGLSILLGWRPGLGALAIIVFLLCVTPVMHAFWKESDPMAYMNQQGQFLKNVALLGAAMFIAAMPQPWPHALSEPARTEA